jgi:hypothetical protein
MCQIVTFLLVLSAQLWSKSLCIHDNENNSNCYKTEDIFYEYRKSLIILHLHIQLLKY